MKDVACERCRFWDRESCRRFPPVAVERNGFHGWPQTHARAWCGEFAPSGEENAA